MFQQGGFYFLHWFYELYGEMNQLNVISISFYIYKQFEVTKKMNDQDLMMFAYEGG